MKQNKIKKLPEGTYTLLFNNGAQKTVIKNLGLSEFAALLSMQFIKVVKTQLPSEEQRSFIETYGKALIYTLDTYEE